MGEDSLQRLVEDAVGCQTGDRAWQRLWAAIEPGLWAMVDRPRFASHLAHTEDARHRIVSAIHAQLVAGRCHQLQLYLDAHRLNPRLSFERWLRTMAKRIGLSYARSDEPGLVKRRSARRITV